MKANPSPDNVPKLRDYKLIFEQSPVAIAISHLPDGEFVAANEAFLSLHGYSRDEVIGHTSSELQLWNNPEERNKMLDLLEQQGHVLNFVHEYRCKSGRIGSAVLCITSVKLSDDPHLLGYIFNVGDLTTTQQELLEIERHYSLIFEHMLTGFAYCRMLFENGQPQDYVYLLVNKAFEKNTGLTNVVGRKVSDVIPDLSETNPDLINIYARVAQGGPPEHFEIYLNCLQKWFSISVHSPKPEHFIAVFYDITERKQLEDEMCKIQQILKATERIGKIGGWELSLDSGKQKWTDEIYAIHEVDKSFEPNVTKGISFYTTESRPIIENAVKRAIELGESYDLELEIITAKGKFKKVHALAEADLEHHRLFGVFQDITERKHLEEELRLQNERNQRYLDTTSALMLELDTEGKITMINRSLENLLGYAKNELLGRDWFATCIPEASRRNVVQVFGQIMAGDIKPFPDFENVIVCRGGRERVIAWSNTHRLNGSGRVIGTFSSGADVTEHRLLEEEIRQMAFYDQLTKLPNRRLLDDRLCQAMASSKRTACFGAVMFLDLDSFKILNDTHGHEFGDLLLIEVADRLKKCVRERDTVARFGGDEFVVMISELDVEKTPSIAEARIIAEKIRKALSDVYVLEIRHDGAKAISVEHHCAASIGVSLFINHEVSPADIFKWADSAMYQAKTAGGNLIQFHDPEDWEERYPLPKPMPKSVASLLSS
jgi:diguanylate cyclase (GGDEF)-like protein/PAS domain S-box-containing protein